MTTTLERIEAALAHLAPDQQARDDWEAVTSELLWPCGEQSDAVERAVDALKRIKSRRDAAYRELFAAKIEMMGRGEGTSMS